MAAAAVILLDGSFWCLPLLVALLIFGPLRYSKFVFFHNSYWPKCGHNPIGRKADGAPLEEYYKLTQSARSLRRLPELQGRDYKTRVFRIAKLGLTILLCAS